MGNIKNTKLLIKIGHQIGDELDSQLFGKINTQIWRQIKKQFKGVLGFRIMNRYQVLLGGTLRDGLWGALYRKLNYGVLPNQEKLNKAWEKLNAEV